MISVRRVREPKNFDENVRQPGKNQPISNSRPRDLWTPFRPALAKGFKERCAYSAIEIYGGTVDHFLSFRHHPNLTYEWSNYRYCLGSINSRKRNLDELILDPYEVKDGWFEIKIPGYLLKPTNKIPLKYAFLASETIRLLKLNGQDLIDFRKKTYLRYRKKKISLEHLKDIAPLIYQAVVNKTSLQA